MRDAGAPKGRRPDGRSRVRRERASAPPGGTSESVADPSRKPPAGSPTDGGMLEPDASENAVWLVSAGYQIVQMTQAAERERAQVLDEARHQRPDLTDAQYGILTDRGFPLTVPFAATADEVLAYLETFGPPPAPSAAARQAAERERAQVLDEARHQRPDLTDAQFGILTDRGFALTVPFAATADEVLAYINAVRPRVPEPPVVSPRRLRLEQARRKRAVEAAHAQRPDLTDAEFDILASHATLSGHGRTAPREILAYVNAVRPPPPPQAVREPQVASRRRRRLEVALARLSKAGRGAPTEDEIAKACRPQIIDRTVRRWLHDEPELYDLLPWLRARRTK